MVSTKYRCLAAIAFLGLTPMISIASRAHSVERLVITGVGLNDESLNDENEKRACRKFRPTRKELIGFFMQARSPANPGALQHERYSSCAAQGWVRFRDGSSGRWVLKSSGIAWVMLDGGKTIHLFRRRNGWHDPYACTYGLGDEGVC